MPEHLLVLPVVLPLFAAALCVLVRGSAIAVQRGISALSVAGLLVLALNILAQTSTGAIPVYLLGNWPAPFGIALAADRLTALMLLLTAILAAASLWAATAGWDRRSPHFHALFQVQLMGLGGAFLTADLFDLFVFFEVLLIASYGLLLQGGGAVRLRSAAQYVVFNLTGSALFLVGVSLLYGVTGTLNMADLAQRVATLTATEATLARVAGLVLLLVFCVKAALLPLCFWLPATYAAAGAPVAALFAIMTKVGVYSVLRVHGLLYGAQAGEAAHLAEPLLLVLGLATLALGAMGALVTRALPALTGFLIMASSGTLFAAIGLGSAQGVAAALFYLVQSTLVAASLFLLADALMAKDARARHAITGTLFVIAAASAASLPPLPGFIAKLQILTAATVGASAPRAVFWTVLLLSGFVIIIALARTGTRLFWRNDTPNEGGSGYAASGWPAGALLSCLIALTVFAAPVQSYLQATAAQLAAPRPYIDRVLGQQAVVREVKP